MKFLIALLISCVAGSAHIIMHQDSQTLIPSLRKNTSPYTDLSRLRGRGLLASRAIQQQSDNRLGKRGTDPSKKSKNSPPPAFKGWIAKVSAGMTGRGSFMVNSAHTVNTPQEIGRWDSRRSEIDSPFSTSQAVAVGKGGKGFTKGTAQHVLAELKRYGPGTAEVKTTDGYGNKQITHYGPEDTLPSKIEMEHYPAKIKVKTEGNIESRILASDLDSRYKGTY